MTRPAFAIRAICFGYGVLVVLLIATWLPEIMTMVSVGIWFPLFALPALFIIAVAVSVLGASVLAVIVASFLLEDTSCWHLFLWIAFGVVFGSPIAFFVRT